VNDRDQARDEGHASRGEIIPLEYGRWGREEKRIWLKRFGEGWGHQIRVITTSGIMTTHRGKQTGLSEQTERINRTNFGSDRIPVDSSSRL
jgi:hypothetical protein